MKEENMSRG